ncbi:MAG: hypothetical protein JWL95_2288, partial [Gemmatimonadetes bacterium]|nr:hypothetical protein [Gemmatimonadota bacterium]
MRRRSLTLLSVCIALFAAACTFDQQSVAVQPAQVVVHAVLDPGAPLQQVLVERTLSGSVDIAKNQRFDPQDPINTGGGVPISGCEVTITGPDGTVRAVESRVEGKPSTYSSGRYIVSTSAGGGTFGLLLRAGARYELRVRTPDGTVVTGSTVVPSIAAFVPSSRLDPFNRDADSLRLTWRGVSGARSYLLRIESPFGPFLLFSDSTHLTLPGSLRNYFAASLERVFIPGFRQRVDLSAV